ncbi:MAG TPA: tripartite tricarboxylate transporter substrate binding protein [Burkholderiales bacterium]|nr:tripartite tricarboxylate transporter substrate binding protein [Burkholderiales bacterium]
MKKIFAACVLACACSSAGAQGYPGKPVRMIVPSSAGGGSDIIARIIAPKMSERLGQQIVIENRAGAGTMIGNEAAARAAPDGYTLLLGISTLATNPAIYRKVPYNALTDFAPITLVLSAPNILVVHPSMPVKNVKELIWFAQARPGQINYASAGTGTNPHLCMELFLSMAKLDIVHIPYKGSAPAIVDLVAGQVPLSMATMLTGLPHVRSGRLRALGVSGTQRSAIAPDVPTISEAGVPGYEAVQWYGVLAPAHTPKEIVARLHKELVTILRSPDVKERFAADGGDAGGNSPEEFARYIRSETEKWAKVAKAAGIKPE